MSLRSSLAGLLPVASKEGRATFLSPRFFIIVALLALAVLAGTYSILPGATGGAGVPSRVTFNFTYFEGLNVSRPAMALFAFSPTGDPISGLEAQLINITDFRGGEPEFEVLDSKVTDASGWVRFEGLWRDYPDRERLGLFLPDEEWGFQNEVNTYYYGNQTITNHAVLWTRHFPLGGSYSEQTLFLVFTDAQGTILDGANVYVWQVTEEDFWGLDPEEEPPGGWAPYLNGTTDANGFYIRPEPLGNGEYLVRAEKGALNSTSQFGFYGSPNPLTEGPDGILAFTGMLFVPLILPVMALVLAYDAVARERSQGSLDMLLSKPVGRIGVAAGKLLGVFGSMAAPVVTVLLIAAGLIWIITGQAPTGSFLATFMGNALLLLLVYTLLFLAVSANVRNLGTALLISILIFLLFAFFWGLISAIIASVLATPGSVAWYRINVSLSIVSPTGVYHQVLTLAMPALLGGFFGPFGGTAQALPLIWITVAAVFWVAIPLVAFLLAMKYRVTEG